MRIATNEPIRYCAHPDCSYRIGFSASVLVAMQKHRQLARCSLEGGGQLFCTFEDEGALVRVATEPSQTDKRACFRFSPDRAREIQDIKNYHRQGLHYIGDWHTHPQDVPEYSRRDLRSIQECFTRSKHSLRAILLVIVGRAEAAEGIGVWLVNASQVRKLTWQPHQMRERALRAEGDESANG